MSENWSSQKNGSFKVSNALIRKESNQREREREREREFHTKRPFNGGHLGICPLTGAKNIS